MGFIQKFEKTFNVEELRLLCLELKIDYESLGGKGKIGNIRELVQHCKRRNQIDVLLNVLNKKRPKIDWGKEYKATSRSSIQQNTSSKTNKKVNGLGISILVFIFLSLLCCVLFYLTLSTIFGMFPNNSQPLPTIAPTQVPTQIIDITPTASTIAPTKTLPPPPTLTPVPIPTATATLEPPTEQIGYFRSCQEILANGQNYDDYYMIDADGPEGRLEPFEVYCDMTRQGGGWTLFAYHTDGIKVIEVPIVTKTETGVLQGERWRAIRDNMTTGMMFVDEFGRVTTISIEKLNRATCQQPKNPEGLVPPSGSPTHIWHDEDNGCGFRGQDYSVIILQGPLYAGYKYQGASLVQVSAEKFDIWPYNATTASGNEQNELFYYLK